MNKQQFLDFWQRTYPRSYPIGHLLRVDYHERWFRIHTLPDSSQQPTDEADYQEIIHRHHVLTNDFFADATELLLLSLSYSRTSKPIKPELSSFISEVPIHSMTVALHKIEQDPWAKYGHIWLNHVTWPYTYWEALVRDGSDFKIADYLLLEPKQPIVYHPYPGGIDIITTTPDDVATRKETYRAWLSPYPHGL
jgi:hypothetical protein